MNSSSADMYFVSHLLTGLAILEERDDKLLGIWVSDMVPVQS